MQTVIHAEAPDGQRAVAWLHRTNAKRLVVILHGHNSTGDRGRHITMAKWFEHHGFDCARWNAVRPLIDDDTYRVLTPSAELAQVRAIIDKLRPNYDHLTLVGHSQGALLALKLAEEGRGNALVSLMGVVDNHSNAREKLETTGVTFLTKGDSIGSVRTERGTFSYGSDFFEDLDAWDIPALFHAWRGPSLFVEGSRDVLIPPAEVRQGFALANEPKKLLTVDDIHQYSDETSMRIAKEVMAWLADEKNM